MPTPIDSAFAHIRSSFRKEKDLPPIRLSNPAAEFVQNRVEIKGFKTNRLPTTEVGSQSYEDSDDRTSPLKTNELSKAEEEKEVEDRHCKQFAETLQRFEDGLPENHKPHFNLRGKHSWTEVIEEAKIAEMKYAKKADKESRFGRVRGLFRLLQKRSPAIDSWLGLLPSQSEYGSLICGGLKLVLCAATKMGEIRESIIRAMATIPDEVEKAQLLLDYNEDLDTTRLLKKVSELYYVVFDLIEYIIAWYGQKSGIRHFKAMLQQDVYEKKLEEKVDDFKTAVLAVKDDASLCAQRRSRDVHVDLRAVLEIAKNLEKVLLSSPKLHPRTGQVLQSQPQYIPRKKKSITRRSLCNSALRYDRSIPPVDLNNILHHVSDLSIKEQSRIIYVIESPALKAWLSSPRNGVLLLRGNSDEIDNGSSAMSFTAAHVIQSTQQAQRPRLLCLYWFSGQHRNVRSDEDANVHGVVRSLIGQLLHMDVEFDLYFIKGSTARAIMENDLQVLCDVFDELIFQLPPKTVTFCVVDWLACLEYREREEVSYLVERLRAVAAYAGGEGSLFKLLITHAGGAFRAGIGWDGAEVLDVPEGGEGESMEFNKLMWDMKVGKKIGGLRGRRKK